MCMSTSAAQWSLKRVEWELDFLLSAPSLPFHPSTHLIRLALATSVVEPHHFYASLAPGTNFDAAPAAPAPAPTLLYRIAKFLKRTKFYIHVETSVSCSYDSVRFIVYC
jgi:hypothetical protein